jgi:hypothetical protein
MLVTGFFEIVDEKTIAIGTQELEIKNDSKVLEPGFYNGMLSIDKEWKVYINLATNLKCPRELFKKFAVDCTYYQITGYSKVIPTTNKAGKEFCNASIEQYKPKKDDTETYAFSVSAPTGLWAQNVASGTITSRGKIVPFKNTDGEESGLPRAAAAKWELALAGGSNFAPASWGSGLVFSERIDFSDPEIITIGETFAADDEYPSAEGLE